MGHAFEFKALFHLAIQQVGAGIKYLLLGQLVNQYSASLYSCLVWCLQTRFTSRALLEQYLSCRFNGSVLDGSWLAKVRSFLQFRVSHTSIGKLDLAVIFQVDVVF